MTNYKETEAIGTAWKRCKQIVIRNPLDNNIEKNITWVEEDVAVLANKVFANEAGFVTMNYDPEYMVNLRDLVTGERTGIVMKQSAIYKGLYSLYMDAAENRDNYLNSLNSTPSQEANPE